jgi:hypothetical protein
MTGHTHAPSALHPAQPRRQANAAAGSRPDSTARGRPADAAPQHHSVAARAAWRAAAAGPAAQAHAPSCARHTRSSASRGGLGGAAVPSPLLRRLACAPGTGSRACPPSACAPLRWPGAAACLHGSHARQPRGSSRTHEPALFGANARLTADPTHPLPPWQRWTAAPSGRCPPAALVRCRNELARRDHGRGSTRSAMLAPRRTRRQACASNMQLLRRRRTCTGGVSGSGVDGRRCTLSSALRCGPCSRPLLWPFVPEPAAGLGPCVSAQPRRSSTPVLPVAFPASAVAATATRRSPLCSHSQPGDTL